MSVSVGDMSHIAALLTRRHPQLELYVHGVQRTTKRLGSKLISAVTGTHSMPSQQAAHRPNFDGTRARRYRHCDRDLVRPVHARGLQGDHPPQSAPSPMLARQSDAPTHAKLLGSPLSVIGILASRLASMMWRSRSLSR